MTLSLSTPLSKKLGLRYPIVSAPMFIVSNPDMMVACAEAGILGTMPTLNARNASDLRASIEYIRRKTDKPFGLNMTIRMTDPDRLEADIQTCLEFEVPVIVTSYGNPTDIVRRAHEKKMTVFHDVINLKHAKIAQASGVDAVIAVAAGAGGHAGATSPFVLYPYLIENLDVPVIAAGCIATGRQIAASFALGTQLAYIGTRFIATSECGANDEYKAAVINGMPEDIVYTDQVSGVNGNFIRSTVPALNPETKSDAKKWKEIWSAGQGVALAKNVNPIGEVVEDLIREYHDAVAGLPRA